MRRRTGHRLLPGSRARPNTRTSFAYLYIGNANLAAGTLNLVNSTVTNRNTIYGANVGNCSSTILQTGGRWALASGVTLNVAVNGTWSYTLSNGVLEASNLMVASNASSTGRVDLVGTQRVCRVNQRGLPSYRAFVATARRCFAIMRFASARP